ncbi:class I SAM-dependent methyltransferase [Roseivirga sp. E12]|uniref:class I SAM-dependent methyltransferase n=1 Tax=Roseivirga sp. E12 TaxID=2819237 RepID=UPI001ABC9CFD|nr:methyltransferase domain-containing protein [Roseivirga sp. E12]MBO3699852.1 class I SAM-dependent methyltransferase [Roseivirga sp. E12]
MNRKLFILIVPILLLSCGGSNLEKKEESNPSSDSTPSVTERASTGREAIQVDIEDPKRTQWQNPDLILDRIGDLTNKTVADIGAGSGYFTFKIARDASKVIALDIDPKALEYIDSQKEIVGEWSNNIESRLTPPDVPNLLEGEVDIVLIVNTYGYIPNKEVYFPRLLNGMKSGGRLVIVDFKKGEIPVGPADEYKVEPSDVRSFLRKSSFRKIDIDEKSLQYQYIITAEKK